MARTKRKRDYGRGTIFARKDRGTWSIRWRVGSARFSKHGFLSEADAKKQLAVEQGADADGKPRKTVEESLGELAVAWLATRRNASHYDDVKRWELHLAPTLGKRKPASITPTDIKHLIRHLLNKDLAPATVKLVIALLSSLFGDIAEDDPHIINPCRQLSKPTRDLMRSKHDPKNSPYLHEMDDVVRLYHALLTTKSETVAVGYAIGALAGLRTGEIRALRWEHIDLTLGRIHVQQQAGEGGPQALKDRESRFVPIQPSLAPILEGWRGKTSPKGLVCPPLRGKSQFLDDHTMGEYIREVVKDLELGMACSCCQNPATWYEYTRHTYACQYMLAGGTIEDLSRTLGHSSTAITEKHYVHLRRDYYRSASLSLMVTDFSLKAKSDKEPDGSPKVQLGPKLGPQAFFEEQKKEAN